MQSANQVYKAYLTKDFFKAQSAYFDACNIEFLAWQSYNTLQEKTESYIEEDDSWSNPEVSNELRTKIEEAAIKYKQAKLLTQEAKKKYQECGAIV